jgi:RHS repeat-associated protein
MDFKNQGVHMNTSHLIRVCNVVKLSLRSAVGLCLALLVPMASAQLATDDRAAGEYSRFGTPRPQTTDGQTATLLSDGRWLFVGGREDSAVSNRIFTRDFRPADRPGTLPDLNSSLLTPRFGHSSTVLPDGSVLLFGGRDAHGNLIQSAELLDPTTGAVTVIEDPGLSARANHTATLLTDGRVLIAGGEIVDASSTSDAQLWNFDTLTPENVPGGLVQGRADHNAALLSDGRGLLWGGLGNGSEPLGAELFDPLKRVFGGINATNQGTLPPAYLNQAAPAIEETLPASNAVGVPPSARVAVRLSRRITSAEVDSSRLTVVGPSGAITGKIVAAADGLLLFFTPDADLLPGETYTVFLRAGSADASQAMPWSTFSFTTKTLSSSDPSSSAGGRGRDSRGASGRYEYGDVLGGRIGPIARREDRKPPQHEDEEDKRPETKDSEFEDWIPSARHRQGKWRVLGLENEPRAVGVIERAPALEGPTGVTAVSGRVARLNGRPIANAAVSIGGISSRSDRFGRFLLANVPAGSHELFIDGGALRSEGRRYASHYIRVDAVDRKTTVMPEPVFLARLNPANDVTFASPADKEVVLTHAKIPGLEIRIPKGAVLRTRDGKIVTRLNIAPLPVDRVPFALPTNFPVYFTIQPAGVFVDSSATGRSEGIRVIYPNYLGLAAKKRVSFWNYDPTGLGWQVYGHGVVTDDGKQVFPDAGVSQSNLMAFGYGQENVGNAPDEAPPPGNCGSGEGTKGPGPSTGAGDPVDCSTGLFIHRVTDLAIDDTIPIVVTRTYRQNDGITRDFGIGTNHDYGWFLSNASGNPMVLAEDFDLILAAGSRVRFRKVSGTTINDVVYRHTASPTRFLNATLKISTITHAWELTLSDKSVYVFQPHAPNALIGFRDRYGNNLTITRSGSKITKITSPHGRYINFDHDSLGRIITATDNIGRIVKYDYDAQGRLWKVTDPTNHVEEYSYDTADRMKTVKDKRGNIIVTNDYDGNGRVEKQTLADGAEWEFAYTLNGFGRVSITTITDPRNFDSKLFFNSAGYVTKTIHAVGQPEEQTVLYARQTGTNLVTDVTDPLNRVTHYGYDFFGNVASVTRLHGTPNAVTESATYEPTFGNLTSYTDPLNHTVELKYDSLGNLRKVTDALSHSTSAMYDSEGKLATITSPLNQVTQLSYDLGDIAAVTDALNRTASVFTDNVGRVTGVADPQGNRGRVEYDAMNRPLRSFDALGLVTQMTYDQNGNLRTVRDARDMASHEYTYDAINRTKTYIDPLGKVETYNYDANGNVESRIDRKNQTTSFTYDALNRLKTITFADSSTITLTWDAGDRLRVIADSANGTLSHDYDDLDRLTHEGGPEGAVDYEYDDAGRRTEMTVSGQQPVSYAYDDADRLTGVSRGGQVIGFNYDAANRRTGVILPNGITTTYGYDNGDQLLSIAYDKGATHIGELTYSYDSMGRRIGMGGSFAKLLMPSTIASATYNAANQLTQWGSASITYDDNGNMLTAGAAGYSWNARDELAGTTDGSGSFTYDALGRRRGKNVSSNSTSYLHDGANPVGLGGEAVLAGLDMDEIYTHIGASSTFTRLTDALGSTVALTDDSGAIAAGYSYSVYGQASKTGAADTAFQFTGRENDGGANLYYYRARYYSPGLNRFISEDPIGLNGGPNTFAYVDGDPTSFTDPTGEFIPQLLGAALGAGLEYLTNPCASAGDILMAGALGALGGGASKAAFLRFGSRSLTRETGKVWSHSVSRKWVNANTSGWLKRFMNRRGGLNGSWTSPRRHYKHDTSAWPSGWGDWGSRWSAPARLLDRVPDWLKGTLGGAAAGSAAAGGGSDCGCGK